MRRAENVRSWIVVILCVFMLSQGLIIASTEEAAAGQSLSPRKIVSLVYDDSASMYLHSNPSWAYANYAMQTFTGLMNSEDTLMVTYMSNQDKVVSSEDSGGILGTFRTDRQKTVDKIRSETKGGSVTPFDAIDTAGKALLNTSDTDQSTQYWLVIITDGDFEKIPGDEKSSASKNELNKKLDRYAGVTAANGTPVQCMYMAIGEKDSITVPSESSYVTVERSRKSDIVDTMSEIADQISGRYRLPANEVKADGKTIEISSAIPLLNIQILTQNSNAKVKSAALKEGSDLSVSSINIASPKNVEGRTLGDKLFGNLGTVVSSGDYIDEGTYTIEMTKSVKKEDLVILYEPALEMRIQLVRGDQAIEDVSVLRQNETVDVYCDVVRMGTDKTIDLSLLPAGMLQGMELTIEENGATAVQESLPDGKNRIVYKDYQLQKGETVIAAVTHLKGFSPLQKQIVIEPKKPVVYGIEPAENDLVLNKGQLRGNHGGLEFIVTGDGEPLGQEEVASLIGDQSIQLTKDGEETNLDFTYEVQKNGRILVTPKASFMNRALAIFRIPTGDYKVKVSISDKVSTSDQFKVVWYTVFQILWNALLLLLIIILTYLIGKPHFPRGKILITSYSVKAAPMAPLGFAVLSAAPEAPIKMSWMSRFFHFGGPRKIRAHGIELIARKGSKVYLSKKWAESQAGQYQISASPAATKQAMNKAVIQAFKKIHTPRKSADPMLIEIPMVQGETLYVASGRNIITYQLVKK